MKKIYVILVLLSTNIGIYAQVPFLDDLDIKITSFSYKDSIDGKTTFGDYEPTSMIATNDGCLVISTTFSLFFPDQYKNSGNYTPEYFQKQKIFREKAHISSGSIFKLNNNKEKLWEVFFKDRRVTNIKLLSDNTILAVGEDVSMEFFWIAKLNPNGEILFEKKYTFKQNPGVQNITTDCNDNIYVLLSTERLKWVQTSKIYGRRKISFFKETEDEGDLYLIKILPNGKMKWKKPVDNRKNSSSFGYDLIVHNEEIYITSSFDGFKKMNKEYVHNEGRMLHKLNKKGKVIDSFEIENKRLLLIDNMLYFVTAEDKENMTLYRSGKEFSPVKTIQFENIKKFRTQNSLSSNKYNYIAGTHHHNPGCLLLQLDKQNNPIGYWKNDNESFPNFVEAALTANNSITILAKEYIKPTEDATKPVYRVNLIEISGLDNR